MSKMLNIIKCNYIQNSAFLVQLQDQNPSPMRKAPRPGQRNRRGDYHQLLQASPTLVRRRRSLT